jgi:hypothetical protein
VVVKKKFSRKQLLGYTAKLKAALIGTEACSGAHFLGAALRDQGHDVRLIPAQFVKPVSFVPPVRAASIRGVLEPRVLRLGLPQDGNVGIGVLPQREELVVCFACTGLITRRTPRSRYAELCEGPCQFKRRLVFTSQDSLQFMFRLLRLTHREKRLRARI